MKRILCFLFVNIFLVNLVFADSHYIPTQLDQFQKTGACEGCDLSEAYLSGRNNADLQGALLVKANLSYSSFYSSNFSHSKLMYAEMNNTKASGSNFNGADLTGASLSYGNFSSCDFTNANLTGADLAKANLAWAIISTTQLAEAKTLSCAIMPDGTRHAPDQDSRCY